MEYREALGWLAGLPDWERGTGRRPAREELWLARPRELLSALGEPQKGFRSVLVAGTKGKGSTAAMLASILNAAGVRTGLYTSPHLHSYRERIRLGGREIAPTDFARGVGEIRARAALLLEAHPDFESFSTFEALTALALWYFAEQRVAVAVLEVGLGGRLDATNVVDAELSIITPISLEHTAILGDTLPKIAGEKAGIIKPGKVVLSAMQAEASEQVIASASRYKGAHLGMAGRDWLWLGQHDDFLVAGAPRRGLWRDYWKHTGLQVPLGGVHQLENASVAVAAAEVVRQNWGLAIEDEAVRQGLAATEWFGRLEVMQAQAPGKPLIVVDGAHNGDSARRLMDALKFQFRYDALWLVLGVFADKDLRAIAEPFLGAAAGVWTVQAAHPRSRSADEVAQVLNGMGLRAVVAGSVTEGIAAAQRRARAGDLICVTGSLAVAAEARAAFGKGGEP